MYRSFNALLILLFTCNNIKSDNHVVPKVTDYFQFVDNKFAHVRKCCPLNTALQQTNETLECSNTGIKFENFQIFSTNILTNDSNFINKCYNIECVDYIKNGTEWYLALMKNCEVSVIYKQFSYFPKCCPFDYSYDPKEHKCVHENVSVFGYNGSLQAISLTLSHCAPVEFAITDFHDDFKLDYDSKSINIGRETIFKYGTYCIDRNAINGKDMIRACLQYEEVCVKLNRRCLKKCCRDGQIYTVGNGPPICIYNYTASFNLFNNTRFNASDNEYGIIYVGRREKYPAGKIYHFYIDELGFFHGLDKDVWITRTPKDSLYCIENMLHLGELSQYIFLLVPPYNQFEAIKFFTQGIILGVSCFLLLITIICYLILPEMQNVHGKSMLMFCIFMFVGCFTLCFMQLTQGNNINPPWICVSVGITIIFSFLGSFAWMNVICFDMWMAFGTMKVLDVRNKKKDMKKFLCYNVYAWGVPITICGLALFVYQTECLSPDFTPQIDWSKCYFKKPAHSYDYLIFFIVPEATMILVNVVLFIKTSMYCYKVKHEIQQMRNAVGNSEESKKQKLQADKENLVMLLKLFLVMGISWTSEAVFSVLSYQKTFPMEVMEAIGDSFNAAQGIIISFIFIMKKKVFLSIKTRLGVPPTSRISEFSSVFTTLPGTNVGLYNLFILCHFRSPKRPPK